MAFLPVRTVITNIQKRNRIVSGKTYVVYDAYLGIDPSTQKPVRMAMADKKKLEDAIRTRYKGLQGLRGSEVMLTPEQIKDAAQAILALSDANMSLTLTECARLAIASPLLGAKFNTEQSSKKIGEAFNEYCSQFVKGTVHRKTIYSRVGRWINALDVDRPIASVTEKDVVNYCKQYENQKTYNNYFTYIRSFLNWCAAKRQRYITENPLEGIKVVAPQWKRPKYLTAPEAEKIFRALEKDTSHTDCLAYAIVAFFCGVRAAEIERAALEHEDAMEIDIPNKTITIIKVKRYTQGAHPRSFTIPENALAWMKSFDFISAWKQITTKTIDGIITTAEEVGVKYPRNGARHSFITHHFAAYESLDKTCKIAGTSAQMVKNNYSGLGKQPDGLAYFAIMPR